MSILIKGIDMPNKIDLDFHDNHIVLGGVLYPIDIDQLVYIPTPHGRLIDGDEVMKQLQADKREAFTKHNVWLMLSKYGAPTILEAEE